MPSVWRAGPSLTRALLCRFRSKKTKRCFCSAPPPSSLYVLGLRPPVRSLLPGTCRGGVDDACGDPLRCWARNGVAREPAAGRRFPSFVPSFLSSFHPMAPLLRALSYPLRGKHALMVPRIKTTLQRHHSLTPEAQIHHLTTQNPGPLWFKKSCTLAPCRP